MDIFDLYPIEQRELARNTLVGPYSLIDLNQEKTEDIVNDPWIALLLNALKYGPKKTNELLQKWAYNLIP